MKIIKFFLFAVIMCHNSAQAQYYFNNYNSYPISTLNDSIVRSLGIREIFEDATYVYKRNKSNSYRRIFQYDKTGHSTFSCGLSDTTDPRFIAFSRIQNMSDELDHTSVGMYTIDKNLYTRIPFYDQNGKVYKVLLYNRKNRISHSYTMIYKDSNMVQMNYYNSKFHLVNYYKYDYAGKKIKSVALYDRKAKLIRFWDYSCDEEGKMQKNNSDTSKICEFKTYMSDGSIVTTRTSFGAKGKPYKSITHRDSSGKLLKWLNYEGTEQILTYKEVNTYSNGKIASRYIWYGNFKGRHYYSKNSKMDNNGKIVDEVDTLLTNPNKPIINRYTFLYNDKGLLIETKGFEREKLSVIRRYRYSFFK